MIRFSCPCGRQLQAPEANAGQKAKCPICGEITVIPSEDSPPRGHSNYDPPPQREGSGYTVRDEEPAPRYDRSSRRDDRDDREDRYDNRRRDDYEEEDTPYRKPRNQFARQGSGMCKEAQTSMILGIVGLFCCEICSIIAIVMGVVALGKINASGGELDGKGQAIAGIVMGAIKLVGVGLYILFTMLN